MQSLAYFQDQLVVKNEYFSDLKNTILGKISRKIYSIDFLFKHNELFTDSMKIKS